MNNNNYNYNRGNNNRGNYNNNGANYNNNNNNNNNNQPQQPQREPLRIEVESPIPFDGELRSKMTTTVELSKNINNLFKIFHDFEGSIVVPDMYGQLQVMLYFKDKGNIAVGPDQVRCIEPVGMNNNRSGIGMFSQIQNLQTRYSQKKYQLTQDAKDIFSEFINVRPGSKINWNQFVKEITEQTGYYSTSITVEVAGIDILKLIRKIYGSHVTGTNGKDKARLDYNINLIKPFGIDMNSGAMSTNYLIAIQQLNSKEVEKLAQEMGLVPSCGTIPMIRV